jgi:diacylglycerol kinase family enzyme
VVLQGRLEALAIDRPRGVRGAGQRGSIRRGRHPVTLLTILLNPGAGTSAASDAERIAAAFRAHGRQATIVTVAGHDLVPAARRAISGPDSIVVAAGGDGTVSAVASAVAGTSATLGVLPLGTLNHFAKDIGIPVELEAAVRVIAGGETRLVDVGDVNGHRFLNNSSVGLYPRLVWERVREQRRGRRKWPAFGVALLRVWRRFRRVRVAVGHGSTERVVHTPFVFVGNNEYQLEGVRMGGRHRLDGGCLHVCMAPGLQRLDMIRILLAALVGRLHGIDRFESVLAQEFSIAAHRRRLGVSIDGELVILRTPLRYRVQPEALRVLVPPRSEPTP